MRKDILGVLFSNFMGAGLGFVVNIFLARILSVEEYGKINFLFTNVILIFTIFEFGFTNSLVVFYNKHKDKHANVLLFVNTLYYRYLLLIVFLLIGVVLVIGNRYSLTYMEISILGVNVFMFLIYRYFLAIYQAKGEWKKFNFWNVMNNIVKITSISLGCIILAIIFKLYPAYEIALLFYGLYGVVLTALILFFSKENFGKIPLDDTKLKKDFYKVLLPLGFSAVIIVLIMKMDVFFIEKYLGMEQLGIFMAANTLALVFPLITSSLMKVFMQQASSEGKSYINTILKNQRKYIPYLLIVLIAAYFLSEVLFLTLFGNNYLKAIEIFKILIFAYIGGVFFTPLESYFYANHQKIIMSVRIFQLTLLVILFLLVIKIYGLVGVAFAIVLSRLVGWLVLYLLILKKKSVNA